MVRLALLVVLLLTSACTSAPETTRCPSDELPEPDPDLSCEVATDRMSGVRAELQACSLPSDCGTIARGQTCGCTRSPVLNKDAASRICEWDAALDQLVASCGQVSSTCDCPVSLGYACVGGRCRWNR